MAALKNLAVVQQLKQILLVLAVSLALIWLVSLYGLSHHDTVYELALVPRNLQGLTGILTMPLVHGSLTHLSVNTSLYVVMAALLLLRGIRYYLLATGLILLLGGSVIWLVARDGAHIGASALIFGYFGLLATRGFFERRFWSILLSLCVAGAYAGLLWGIVPGDDGVSWEGHLAGLLAGVVVAYALAKRAPARR